MLTGRARYNSLSLSERPYQTKRLQLLFEKGLLFYAEYNIRLFFFLLFSKFDILLSNDLDTLPANFLVAKIRFKKLVYDSHEYFTEVPELINRKTTRGIWMMLEKLFLPRVKYSFTVCGSIAKIYNMKYGILMNVVRNLPLKLNHVPTSLDMTASQFGINKTGSIKIILYQGALNTGRGIEIVIRAMKYIDNAVFVIIGDGDITRQLKLLAEREGVGEKVKFTGKIPFELLPEFTKQADASISLEENTGLSYYYSLPNKLFDYIQAGVPVLVSDLPEMKKIVGDYRVGLIAENRAPEAIAGYLKAMLGDDALRVEWKSNLEKAAVVLCWENEKEKLIDIFAPFL